MSTPVIHAQNSAATYGGRMEDYLKIHQWFDESKIAFANYRHRALRHHSFGIFACEQFFGPTIKNSDGKDVPTRLIAEQHVREDCGGRIPSVEDWLRSVRMESWMSYAYDLRQENQEGNNRK